MVEILSKREKFLKQLNKLPKRYVRYSQSIGPGIKNILRKFFYAPDLYIPHILSKLGIIKPKISGEKVKRKLFWGKEIIIEIKDPDSYSFAKFIPISELNLIKFFIKIFKNDDIFYDVGANYGLYTYLALEFCKEVHSFEPIPHIFDNLKFNLSDVKNIYLNNLALSDDSGITNLFLNELHFGSSSIVKDVGDKFKGKNLEVKTITLDEYAKSHNPPTIIKIDVEDAESLVIKGGINVLKDYNPIISMEVWLERNGGDIHREAIDILRKLGYKSYFIDAEGEIHETNDDLPLFTQKRGLGLDNYIFKK